MQQTEQMCHLVQSLEFKVKVRSLANSLNNQGQGKVNDA